LAAATGIAALYARGDVGVALSLWDKNFAAPIKPRQTFLAMSRRGSNVDPFVFRPPALFPISLAAKNEQVAVVV